MSGSDAPTYAGAGPGGSKDDPCSSLILSRPLEGPVPGVADALAVGAILTLQLRQGPPKIVAAVTADGLDAGSILPTQRLLDCLEQGVAFEAHVDLADGGLVQTTIRAAAG
jgi:hypothetical protein